MRPLPEITPANEWFWRSGEDGRLRIQACQDCATLVHPPVPICPNCRSLSSAPREVTGRATIAGYTVNSQQWHPDFVPPYVIAVVALEEDPHVRLTTNIVECDPDEVHVGQQVKYSTYEDGDKVWLTDIQKAPPAPKPEKEKPERPSRSPKKQ